MTKFRSFLQIQYDIIFPEMSSKAWKTLKVDFLCKLDLFWAQKGWKLLKKKLKNLFVKWRSEASVGNWNGGEGELKIHRYGLVNFEIHFLIKFSHFDTFLHTSIFCVDFLSDFSKIRCPFTSAPTPPFTRIKVQPDVDCIFRFVSFDSFSYLHRYFEIECNVNTSCSTFPRMTSAKLHISWFLACAVSSK